MTIIPRIPICRAGSSLVSRRLPGRRLCRFSRVRPGRRLCRFSSAKPGRRLCRFWVSAAEDLFAPRFNFRATLEFAWRNGVGLCRGATQQGIARSDGRIVPATPGSLALRAFLCFWEPFSCSAMPPKTLSSSEDLRRRRFPRWTDGRDASCHRTAEVPCGPGRACDSSCR